MAKDKQPETFTKLTFGAFENTVRPRCQGYISYKDEYGYERRKSARFKGVFDMYVLLRSGYSDEDWLEFSYGRTIDNTKSMLSRMRESGDIPPSIVDVYLKDDVEQRIERFFEKNLLSIISQEAQRIITDDLLNIIERDITLPGEHYYRLWDLYRQKAGFVAFISKAFHVSMLRQTMPLSVIPSRFMYENNDLFPEMADYIQTVCEKGFQEKPFKAMVDNLACKIASTLDQGPEYRRLQWNMVSFWKTVHFYVDREKISADVLKKYDDIRFRAYLREFDDFVLETGLAAEKMLERYDMDRHIRVKYERYGRADAWKVSFMNNTIDD